MSTLGVFREKSVEELERDSPSIKDGMNWENERRLRTLSAKLIQNVGIKLTLPQICIATAVTYFHRFFAQHSFKKHDRLMLCAASLLLASKVEEAPRPLKSIITCVYLQRFK